MAGFFLSPSGLFVPKSKTPIQKKEKAYDCAFCNRNFFLKDEVRGKLHLRDDKPVCPVCRATKFSKRSYDIKRDGSKKKSSEQKAVEHSRDKETKRVEEIAAKSTASKRVSYEDHYNKDTTKRKHL